MISLVLLKEKYTGPSTLNREVSMSIDLYSIANVAARLLVKLATVSTDSRVAPFAQCLITKPSPFVNSNRYEVQL